MKFITPQMFDIRPRDRRGQLDMERIKRINEQLDLRGVKPEQPSLPWKVRVARDVSAPKAHVPLRRRGSLSPRTTTSEPPPVLGVARSLAPPENLPVQFEDEELPIPTPKRTASFPWSFAVSVLVAMLLVPSFAFIGSVQRLETGLAASVSDAANVLESATRAMASFDTETAEGAFATAAGEFQEAQQQLAQVGFGTLSLIAEFPVSAKLTSGKAVLVAGEHLASAGEALSQATAALSALRPDQFLSDVFSFSVESANARGVHAQGVVFEDALLLAAGHLQSAADELERIDLEVVPEQYRTEMTKLKEAIPTIRASVSAIHGHARSIAGMLGMREIRRYLVLLQNASELRPSGGFVGNIALLTVANGQIVELEVDDTYRFDGQITEYSVPPVPIQDISAAWSLHDSNWFRDFPTSAAIAATFFEEQGGATPDGVIGVTSRMIERALHATGPLTLDDGTVITADSMVDTLNALGAEQRPGETIQVRLVAELLPKLIERIAEADAETHTRLAESVQQTILAGDLQVWLRDPAEQALVQQLGLSGALPENLEGDVFGVVHANINGFKSERVIGEAVRHTANVLADGTVRVDIELSRHHHGDAAAHDFYRQVSKSYTRILIPKGATVLAAQGFTCKPEEPIRGLDYETLGYRVYEQLAAYERSFSEDDEKCIAIGEENGMNVVAGWLFTAPGETTTLRLSYVLPRRLQSTDSYRLLVLKQPGFEQAFSTKLKYDPVWNIAWADEGYDAQGQALVVPKQPLTQNHFFGAVLEKH